MPPKKQKVLQLDDEPKVKKEAGVEEEEEEARREGEGAGGGEGVVEALVASNSRLCAQVAACDARAFVELERARVLEVQLTEVKAESKAQASVSQAMICAKDAFIQAKDAEIRARDVAIQAKDAENSRLQADNARLQTELARRDAQLAAVTLPQPQQHLDRLQQQLSGQVVKG